MIFLEKEVTITFANISYDIRCRSSSEGEDSFRVDFFREASDFEIVGSERRTPRRNTM